MAYRITLTVRDSAGLTATRTLDVTPNVATINLRTKPAGGTLTIDGQPVASGTLIPSVVGFRRSIGAAATQTINGTTYTFRSWSDGGAVTHTISTPLANTAYTASYNKAGGGSGPGRFFLADAGPSPGDGREPTAGDPAPAGRRKPRRPTRFRRRDRRRPAASGRPWPKSRSPTDST